MALTTGLLYVTMQPHQDLSATQFHDWYNNEHGPTRLRYPEIFGNGFRYRATDSEQPEWLALYDLYDVHTMRTEPYWSETKPPRQSKREQETRNKIDIVRRSMNVVDTQTSTGFKKLEDVENEGEGNVLVTVMMILHGENTGALDTWYGEEHMQLLKNVSGWRRSRRYMTSDVDEEPNTKRSLIIHEFAPSNGLDGEDYKAAMQFPKQLYTDILQSSVRRTYELYYTFTQAPRYLTNVVAPFTSTDNKTHVNNYEVESYMKLPDGVELKYRLEGSKDQQAPLILLSNSILVNWTMWDTFVHEFMQKEENKKYRILRYNTRGRYAAAGEKEVTIDLLGDDAVHLLDALRVEKAAAVIGVSMGGATVMNVGLRYPNRTEAFIACDTNPKAPADNPKGWDKQIAIAEKEHAPNDMVGEQMAEVTVHRWFSKESFDGGEKEKQVNRVKEMIATNSRAGFEKSVHALYYYDQVESMKSKNSTVRGAFFVGGSDGILPQTMKNMSEMLNGGAKYVVIDGTGHLPMVEKPKVVADEVTKFLEGY